MSHVLYRDLRIDYPVAVRGDGVYVIDAQGKRYLDGSGGAAVSCLGHSDPEVIAAIKAQLDRLPWVHSSFFTTEPAEELADLLIADAPSGLERVYLVSGGSEAVEAALKLARQYFLEVGQPQRRHVIARRQSFHGNTLGALATGGNAQRRRSYQPLLFPVTHVAPCYAYRDRRPDESEEAYGRRLALELEAEIVKLGPDSVIAFVAETVVGATLGAVPAVPGYFRLIREVCDRFGILLILDEVMSGMGRTGTLHACEQEGIAPDILVVAKGLGGGYQPIGAVLASRRICEAIQRGSGAFQHGHTYMAHATACAAALAVQRVIRSRGLVTRVRTVGETLRCRLSDRFARHPNVGDIRGRGLLRALELVKDRATREPFEPGAQVAARVKQAALARGLICYPVSGVIDGERGDHVLLAPPYVIEEPQLDELVDKLAGALDDVLTPGTR